MEENKLIGIRIKQRREQLNLTQEDLGARLSLNKSTINRYESGEVQKIKIPILHALARLLDVDPNWLALKTDDMGSFPEQNNVPSADNIVPIPKMAKIPLLGNIACGDPITAEENLDGFVSAPEEISADFALRCKGDSMIGARILDGDIVLIRQQPDVEDGEIAAVLIDNEATLKRVHKKTGCLILNPANPAYEPIIIAGEELNDVRIIGKAVYFISAVK